MRYFVISDNDDTLIGMRLAGIEGKKAVSRDDVREAINFAISAGDIGILLISERCATLCTELIDGLKLTLSAPLLIEIPDREGSGRASDSITRYIRESIGIKI